jgi:hypothetical protein
MITQYGATVSRVHLSPLVIISRACVIVIFVDRYSYTCTKGSNDFEFFEKIKSLVEKSSKIVYTKKVRGLRTFVLNGEKVHNFYIFMLITFSRNFFLHFFRRI